MTLVWRISQTGPILSLFFWSTALAGIFWPIVGITSSSQLGPLGNFLLSLGISLDRITIVGLILLFFLFAAFILLIGWLYDRVLKLWREQMDVTYDRNPYVDDRLFRKEIMQWDQYFLPLAKAVYKVSPDPELRDAIERVETWIATGKINPK
ncbi:MAG TPA: hypothetical protein VGR51_02555 [Thermoplasmata archaeon]|nr:hypothetical protein [Thermoplasmata archaeon]